MPSLIAQAGQSSNWHCRLCVAFQLPGLDAPLARSLLADRVGPCLCPPTSRGPAGYGNWYDAPLPLVQGGSATYFGASVPFDLGTLAAIEFAAMAGAESFRGAAEAEKRVYPGGAFDPMGMVREGSANRECVEAAALLQHA